MHDRAVPRIIVGDTVRPVDATVIPRYAGEATFARLPRLDEVSHADVAVLGVPFDSGVSYRPGARFGPSHIRESSRLLRPYNPACRYRRSPPSRWPTREISGQPVQHRRRDQHHRAGRAFPAGADAVRADPGRRSHGGAADVGPLLVVHGPVAVVHFDAHLDTWDTYFGAPYTHGTPFRHRGTETPGHWHTAYRSFGGH